MVKIPEVAAALAVLVSALTPLPTSSVAQACAQPTVSSIASAFDLAANGLLPASYPQLPSSNGVRAIPPSVLKAVGWVESGWRQYTPQGRPLVSFDFGYGIMQITSGMAGAFDNAAGSIDLATQSRIASEYTYNIAYGAQMLARKWAGTPRIGDGDPAVVENWYYALWAYNGWGWVNNPNNPRFTRRGTPASDPAAFPYQERVLYLVAHPPRDKDGNPLWEPVPVTLPSPKLIGDHPGPLQLTKSHRQDLPALSAVYAPASLPSVLPQSQQSITVRVVNTGTEPWTVSGSSAVSLAYHLFTSGGDPWQPFSPFTPGVLAFGQSVVQLPHSLLPGKAATVVTTVLAPAQPGTYLVAWDLQQGASQWFSQEGVLPRAQTLHVIDPSRATSTTPSLTPTPTPAPAEDLRFVADTSIPDGSVLSPRLNFVKGWLVYNCGKRSWGSGWVLRLVSGKPFGARMVTVLPTRACHATDVLAALRSPNRPGQYRSVWRMQDPQGHFFGDPLTLVVTVRSGGPRPTPLPTAGVSPTPRPTRTPLAPTPTPTPVG